ncbi:LOW QUALITY PROTEIN: hypothetical protein Cgig2_009240 [Carnegiea gigantea]|uniref:Uncharacterized protein n=1 Tax=Carnegiea gigantea TaxID=171969 RepID=A0A9Q1GL12_9CARY|nr:LOW QUALITY PROTEIN: hypothetical protein Cgig2_009240 [Carnegiea gigantea]
MSPSYCIAIVMRVERSLAQTGVADHKESTVTGPWERAPHRTVIRAKDNRQGQPWHQRHKRHIPSVPAGGRNRSRPQGLEGKLQDCDALLSVVRIANALTALLLEACKGAPNAKEASSDDLSIETTQYVKVLEDQASFGRNASRHRLNLEKKSVPPRYDHHRGIYRGYHPVCLEGSALRSPGASHNVPIAYNVILGWPTLHKVEAVITSYLL